MISSFLMELKVYPAIWRCAGMTSSFLMELKVYPATWRCAGMTSSFLMELKVYDICTVTSIAHNLLPSACTHLSDPENKTV
jgi:hypothetical protein